MRKARRGPGRTVGLNGVGKWLLVLSLPFSALFFETWINTQTIENDYEMADINRRLRSLGQALDTFTVETARLEALDRIEVAAPDIGLVEPEPGQIEIVYYADANDPPIKDNAPYVLASRGAGLSAAEAQ